MMRAMELLGEMDEQVSSMDVDEVDPLETFAEGVITTDLKLADVNFFNNFQDDFDDADINFVLMGRQNLIYFGTELVVYIAAALLIADVAVAFFFDLNHIMTVSASSGVSTVLDMVKDAREGNCSEMKFYDLNLIRALEFLLFSLFCI
ncbi:hypothetical protein VNO80_14649 [Phaseolus coccineus]|uniref:Uncharacterized protein n=1 Tax=Phaseolus coccineus TaxID=3886 RepID=A0AAN9MIT6_PHACN